jgi:hypothetical protein
VKSKYKLRTDNAIKKWGKYMNNLKEIIAKYKDTVEDLERNYECLKGFHTCLKDEDIRRTLFGTISKLEESQLYITKISFSIDNFDIQKEMHDILRIIDIDRRNCTTWINLALMIGDLGDIMLQELWRSFIQGSGLGEMLIKLRMIFVMIDKYAKAK